MFQFAKSLLSLGIQVCAHREMAKITQLISLYENVRISFRFESLIESYIVHIKSFSFFHCPQCLNLSNTTFYKNYSAKQRYVRLYTNYCSLSLRRCLPTFVDYFLWEVET